MTRQKFLLLLITAFIPKALKKSEGKIARLSDELCTLDIATAATPNVTVPVSGPVTYFFVPNRLLGDEWSQFLQQ